jgi:hypothetical protein
LPPFAELHRVRSKNCFEIIIESTNTQPSEGVGRLDIRNRNERENKREINEKMDCKEQIENKGTSDYD